MHVTELSKLVDKMFRNTYIIIHIFKGYETMSMKVKINYIVFLQKYLIWHFNSHNGIENIIRLRCMKQLRIKCYSQMFT